MLFGKSLECISFGYRQIKVTPTNVTDLKNENSQHTVLAAFPIWNGAEREAGTAPLDKQIKREIICLKNLDTIFISIL